MLVPSISTQKNGDGFRSTFHSFGRYCEACQQLDLLPSMVEGRFRAHQRQHAANTGRQIRFLYVQGRIGRTLPVMAVRTHQGRSTWRSSGPGASPRSNWPNATAPAQCMAARIAISTASRSSLPRLTPVLKHKVQERAYLPFDFLTDRFRRFFSCGVSVCATGRASQISSFVSIRARLSS
jgi:hypothetical protein